MVDCKLDSIDQWLDNKSPNITKTKICAQVKKFFWRVKGIPHIQKICSSRRFFFWAIDIGQWHWRNIIMWIPHWAYQSKNVFACSNYKFLFFLINTTFILYLWSIHVAIRISFSIQCEAFEFVRCSPLLKRFTFFLVTDYHR